MPHLAHARSRLAGGLFFDVFVTLDLTDTLPASGRKHVEISDDTD